MFEDIIAKLSQPSGMTLSNSEELADMRLRFPGVTTDYFEFMRTVGWGDIGGMMIYSGLSRSNEFFAEIGVPSANIVLFGDNWQGDRFGFDLDDGGNLIIVTADGEIEDLDFDFIELMAMHAN